MFSINYAGNHAVILNRYCGFENKAIWGEVQHSVFFKRDHQTMGIHRKTSDIFPNFFSWNKIFNIDNHIAIGDPVIYDPAFMIPQKGGNTTVTSLVLAIPQGTKDLEKQDERFSRHDRFASYLSRNHNLSDLLVTLHPYDEVNQICEIYQKRKIKMLNSLGEDAENRLYRHHLYNYSKKIITNYFGAHVFRAALMGIPIEMEALDPLNVSYDPPFDTLLKDFLYESSNRKYISEIIMGVEFRREREELASLLGFNGFKGKIGHLVQKQYQKHIYK